MSKNKELNVEFISKEIELVLDLPSQEDPIKITYDPDYDSEDPDAYKVSGELEVANLFFGDDDFIEKIISLTDEEYVDLFNNLHLIRIHTKELVKRMNDAKNS